MMNSEAEKYLYELERLSKEVSNQRLGIIAREAVPRLINMVRELDAEADLLADDLAYEGDYCPLDTDQCPKVPCTQEQRGKCWRIAVKQWIEDDDVEEENAKEN